MHMINVSLSGRENRLLPIFIPKGWEISLERGVLRSVFFVEAQRRKDWEYFLHPVLPRRISHISLHFSMGIVHCLYYISVSDVKCHLPQDLLVDWSLFDPAAEYRLLRPELLYRDNILVCPNQARI